MNVAAGSPEAAKLRGRWALYLHWVLRIGVVGEFLGHGWVGLHRPAAWLPFFGVFGLSNAFASTMMPIVGTWDIVVALIVLVRPGRAVLYWATFWGVFTALLRPLADQGWWEFFERAGNYGVPLAFLVLLVRQARMDPVSTLPIDATAGIPVRWLSWDLRLTVASLMIGHGGIGAFMHRQGWLAYFDRVGVSATVVQDRSLISAVGWFEIALGVAVLGRPSRGLLMFVLSWKVFTEALRPLVGEGMGQFVERFGSYAAPAALLLLLLTDADAQRSSSR